MKKFISFILVLAMLAAMMLSSCVAVFAEGLISVNVRINSDLTISLSDVNPMLEVSAMRGLIYDKASDAGISTADSFELIFDRTQMNSSYTFYAYHVNDGDTVIVQDKICKVDSTYYATVQRAIDAASGDETTIELFGDSIENIVVQSGKNIVLDLNGHVIQGDRDSDKSVTISNAGILRIKDSNKDAVNYLMYKEYNPWILANTSEDAIALSMGSDYFEADKVIEVVGGCITGGVTDEDGGGIRNNGSLVLEGGIVIGNMLFDMANGGGIYNTSTCAISGGSIMYNTAMGGGGVLNDIDATLYMNSGSIAYNTGGFLAGGVLNTGSMIMNGGSINSNAGSGIANNGTVSILGGEISDNIAHGSMFDPNGGGGGIKNSGLLVITNASICDNTAKNGGGIYNTGIFYITGTSIQNNIANENGGGILNSYGTMSVFNAQLCSNTALYCGGGIHNEKNAVATLTGVTISQNIAYQDDNEMLCIGGGVHNFDSSLCLDKCTVSYNRAYYGGGIGVSVYDGGNIVVSDSSIKNNAAIYGGGIYNEDALVLINSQVTSNVVNTSGGVYKEHFGGAGIDFYDGSITLSGKVVVSGNKTNGNADNVFLDFFDDNVTLSIGEDGLLAGSNIGITHYCDIVSPDALDVVTNAALADVSFFKSDNSAYGLRLNEDHIELCEAEPAAEAPSRPIYHGGGGESIFDIKVLDAVNGVISVNNRNATAGTTVTVSVKPDGKYELDTLTVTGSNGVDVVTTSTTRDSSAWNMFTFKMPSCNVVVSATFKEAAAKGEEGAVTTGAITEGALFVNPFVDVNEGDYFYDAVMWAAENGITSGMDATHFNPYGITNRAQMVTFLWKTKGSPKPLSIDCKFTDVPRDAYYYDAVLWALENGLTKGISDSLFAPMMTLTRAQAVTFIARFNGVKDDDNGYECSFSDLSRNDYFYNAVAWAQRNGIVIGMGDGLFIPSDKCTRVQVVVMLYRMR